MNDSRKPKGSRLTLMQIATRRAPLALAVLVTGCCVAACGSSSSSSTTTSSAAASSSGASSAAASSSGASSARRAALVACLRSHGVKLPSRPGGFRPPSGAGGTGATGSRPRFFFGGGAANPKLQAAFKACGANFRGGARLGRVSHQTIQKYVACVRQHGYDLPNPNFSGHGAVFPASIRSKPKFQSASRACQSLLFPARSGSPPSSA